MTKKFPISASLWMRNGDHPLDYTNTYTGLENGELHEFTGEERKARQWEGEVVRYYRHPGISGTLACPHCGCTMHIHGWIDSGGSGQVVCPGNWIVTINNKHFVCTDNLLRAMFPDIQTPRRLEATLERELLSLTHTLGLTDFRPVTEPVQLFPPDGLVNYVVGMDCGKQQSKTVISEAVVYPRGQTPHILHVDVVTPVEPVGVDTTINQDILKRAKEFVNNNTTLITLLAKAGLTIHDMKVLEEGITVDDQDLVRLLSFTIEAFCSDNVFE